MAIAIELTEFDATPTLEIRTRTPVAGLPALIGRNYGLLSAYLAELGVKRAGVPFTSYHNTDMANLDVSMGFAVPPDVPGRGEILASALPSGQAAECLHVGPYAQMSQTYAELFAWLGLHGYQPAGPIYEFYLNSPDEVSESDLRTRIAVPVQRG